MTAARSRLLRGNRHRMRRSLVALLGVAAGCLILASGCGGSDAQGVAHSATPSARVEAASAAETLLASDERLPSSRPVARPPSVARALLDRPIGEPFAHVVDRHAFLLSRAAPSTLLRAFAHDAPASARVLAGGSARDRHGFRYWWEEIGVPRAEGTLGPRRLGLAIARAEGNAVAARIDARVAFHLPHSPAFVVPGSATRLAIRVVQGELAPRRRKRPRVMQTVTVADPSRVARIAAAVNALAVYEPTHPAPSCPVGGPSAFVVLTFRAGGRGPIVASVRAYPRRCTVEAVSLVLPGKPPYELTGSGHLLRVVEREARRRLQLP